MLRPDGKRFHPGADHFMTDAFSFVAVDIF